MRFATALCVLLLPALAWAQGSTGYDYRLSSQHAQGSLVFRAGNPPSATLTIDGIIQADGALAPSPEGWRLDHAPPSLKGMLDAIPLVDLPATEDSPRTEWVLAGEPGAILFEVRLLHDGRAVGRYHARLQIPSAPTSTSVRGSRPRGPVDAPLGAAGPPVDTSKLVRNRWWSRGFVGVWGITTSMWDVLRGRDGTHLRGDVTPAQVGRLHARLARSPRPWSMRTIYRAARGEARSVDEALQLAFAYSLEHPEAPVRPLRGLPAGEALHDKTMHFFASAILARRSNSTGSVSVGLLKELKDELPGGSGFNEHDVTADVWGALFGEALLVGRTLDP